MINWNNKWKSVLVWLSAYLNFIAFVLVGGFFYVKKEDEEVQTATKNAFLVTLIFTAYNAFWSIFNSIGVLVDGYYSSGAYRAYSVCTGSIAGIARIIVYAVFIILAIVKTTAPAAAEIAEPKENEPKDGE